MHWTIHFKHCSLQEYIKGFLTKRISPQRNKFLYNANCQLVWKESKWEKISMKNMNLSMAMVLFSCIILSTASTQHFSRKTLQAPWTSCNRYNGFTSILTCERFCRSVFDSLYLLSRDVIGGTCYCCDKKPGVSDEYFPDDVRESYIPGKCELVFILQLKWVKTNKTGIICPKVSCLKKNYIYFFKIRFCFISIDTW